MVTTGAESDLKQVTQIAREMVVRWGMSSKVGPLNLTDDVEGSSLLAQQRPYSEGTSPDRPLASEPRPVVSLVR